MRHVVRAIRMATATYHLYRSASKWRLIPARSHREDLNTMGSYMYSLAQKSGNTNWLARRSYSPDFELDSGFKSGMVDHAM